ncbi:unnamed protein product [Gadus morhua 'NCC']
MDIRNTNSTTKTDLSLLIEVLKFQMKCPESQKQALLAIYSICQNREDNVDLFREMGGVAFVYSLSKSSFVHPDVKETVLFTLGTLAEANVYCKTYLCRKDTFSHLATLLQIPDSPVTLRRVSVYLLSVLVANNKLGQTFAQNTGCLDILLELFRTSFPFSTSDENPMLLNVSQMYQLWTSVANALCGCVNNPQNEDAQRICVAAYPLMKTWLQQITLPRPEMFQPLCFFIAMSVGNNSYTQESFSASGCLETLTCTLVRLAADAEKSLLCCQISVIITKTLSSCFTDNAVSVRALAQYGLVPQLVSLLSSAHLEPKDRIPVLLTLGHCTEASEEHQHQLVQCGGLSAIITLLTESPSEELRKATTFILQTCKQATMSLGGPAPDCEEAGTFTNMDAYWDSANELLNRIHRLEKSQRGTAVATDTARRQGVEEMLKESLGEEEIRMEFTPLACAKQNAPRGGERECQGRDKPYRWRDSTGRPLPQRNHTEDAYEEEEDQKTSVREGHAASYPLQVSQVRRRIFYSYKEEDPPKVLAECDRVPEEVVALHQNNSHVGHVNTQYSQPESHKASANRGNGSLSAARSNPAAPGRALSGAVGREITCSMCKGTGTVKYTSDIIPPDGAREPHTDSEVLNLPPPMKQSMAKQRKWIADDDALSLCSELLDNEIRQLSRFPENEAIHVAPPLGERCSGCVLPFDAVTSRTFWALQSSCLHICDLHRVLEEASDAFRARYTQETQGGDGGLANAHQDSRSGEVQQRHRGGWRGRGHDVEETAHIGEPKTKSDQEAGSTQRRRNDFSREEVTYLLNGVKKFGFSWNSILWSYPFQPGRTNVNLAKKYRQLMVKAT